MIIDNKIMPAVKIVQPKIKKSLLNDMVNLLV
jgi:hypothetical protein